MTTVAFNALALRPKGTGVQVYIRELLRALAHSGTDARLVATVQADALGALPGGVERRPRPCSSGVRRTLQGLRSLGSADVTHGLDVDLPALPQGAALSTVHDLSVFDVPWAFSRARALGEQAVIRRALRRADAILAVSSFTAERIAARFGRTATVILEAPPSDLRPAAPERVAEVRARYGLPSRFVLHVGSVEPRKDLPTLAESCVRTGVPLVLAGPIPRAADVPRRAVTLGYVPDEDLPALYGAATIVGYPTRYEGFGLPPLEAMVCGAPVLASRVASLPEVLGSAARLVPPGNIDAWSKALAELLADDAERAELAVAGRRRARALSWSDAAEGTRRLYRSLGVEV